MIHNITAGHFDPAGVAEGMAAVTKPLDKQIVQQLLNEFGETDRDGTPTLGGWKVRFEDGRIIVPWLGGKTNRVAEEFAIRLQRATNCTLADREHGRLIEPSQLRGFAGREITESA